VSRLIRIRYGAMVLPRGLKRGAWIELDERDIQSLTHAAGGLTRPQAPEGEARGGGRNKRRGNTRGDGPRPQGGQPPRQGKSQGAQGRRKSGNGGGGGSAQPDPMKTSLGYIGADSFNRQRRGGGSGTGGGPGRGGGPRRGGGRGGR
jgi:23S rRNA pseudouridine2605 synthase